MSEMSTPPAPPARSNQGVIIAVIVVVVLCLCCFGLAAAWYLWNNGDALFGNAAHLVSLLA